MPHCCVLSFCFCGEHFLMIFPLTALTHQWKPLPSPKADKSRFTKIVRSNSSFILCWSALKYFNKNTTDAPHTATDAEKCREKRTKLSYRLCKNRKSVACVIKVFPVVISLHRMSRKQGGHHLPTSLVYFFISEKKKKENRMRRGGSLYLSPSVAIEMANLSWIADLSWFRVSDKPSRLDKPC